MQEELEALGISLDETDDRFEAQLPEAVTDEDAAREAAEAIARLRAERTDSVTVQVALDGGSRLAVTFDGPRFSLAPMHTARTSGDPAHLARFRELAEHAATIDPRAHFDMLHEAARLGTKISPLVLYAYVEHGGDALTA